MLKISCFSLIISSNHICTCSLFKDLKSTLMNLITPFKFQIYFKFSLFKFVLKSELLHCESQDQALNSMHRFKSPQLSLHTQIECSFSVSILGSLAKYRALKDFLSSNNSSSSLFYFYSFEFFSAI